MINENLIGDEKDREIARLKMVIEKFKEYDKERKGYYSSSMQELGKLRSYIQELESEDDGKGNNLIKKIENLRRENASLKLVLKKKGLEENYNPDDFDINKLSESVKSLKSSNKKLRREIRKIKELNDYIYNKIYFLQSKINSVSSTVGECDIKIEDVIDKFSDNLKNIILKAVNNIKCVDSNTIDKNSAIVDVFVGNDNSINISDIINMQSELYKFKSSYINMISIQPVYDDDDNLIDMIVCIPMQLVRYLI